MTTILQPFMNWEKKMGGRNLSHDVRRYVVDRLKAEPNGLTPFQLSQGLKAAGIEYSKLNLNIICWELAGVGALRGFGQLIHCDRFESRRNHRGQRITGGRPSPVFVLGPGVNADRPPLTKSAARQRDNRAKERAAEKQHQDRVETERRRALKRKPAMDALTCALFGRPLPKK